MKTVFNAEALVSVKIEGMRLCKQLEYQPYKKGFFFGSIEGFYDGFGIYTKEHLRANGYYGVYFIIRGNELYFKPNVTLNFAGGTSTNKEFETYEEAHKWGMEQVEKGINVKIEL